jgi:hypothetical protein
MRCHLVSVALLVYFNKPSPSSFCLEKGFRVSACSMLIVIAYFKQKTHALRRGNLYSW